MNVPFIVAISTPIIAGVAGRSRCDGRLPSSSPGLSRRSFSAATKKDAQDKPGHDDVKQEFACGRRYNDEE
ncbi:MAG: hypothetical protein IOC82_13755 [Aestuariivirga sp.]|nr:hypothetical protein [Aestuariivirga sp.]